MTGEESFLWDEAGAARTEADAVPPAPPLPAPPPVAPQAPQAPLTSEPWSARGAIVFGVVAVVANAAFAWAIGAGPLAGVFMWVAKQFASLPRPLAVAAYLGVFMAFNLMLYALLLLTPLLRAVRRRQSAAEAFGMRRFSVGSAVGLVLAFYFVGIMANGVWGMGLKEAGVTMPGQEISGFVRALSGVDEVAKATTPDERTRAFLATLPRFLLLFGLMAVVAPVVEEIVYRGVVYASLREAWSEVPAVLVSSLLFGIVHIDWRFVVPAMVLGMLLALIFKTTRSLWPAILLHATYNGLSLLLVYFVALFGGNLT